MFVVSWFQFQSQVCLHMIKYWSHWWFFQLKWWVVCVYILNMYWLSVAEGWEYIIDQSSDSVIIQSKMSQVFVVFICFNSDYYQHLMTVLLWSVQSSSWALHWLLSPDPLHAMLINLIGQLNEVRRLLGSQILNVLCLCELNLGLVCSITHTH